MTAYKWGKKRFEFHKGLPRLFLHEKHEILVRWVIRVITLLGIVFSVITFEWYISLSVAIALVLFDAFLERTLFYYTSMFVSDMVLDYDPDQWVATIVISLGEPDDPRSKKIIGIWLKTEEYAKRFFSVLHNWTGTLDLTQGDLRLSFIVDEDMYYVFLYCDPLRESFKKFKENVEKENMLKKFGKAHFPLFMFQIICKGFETTKGFALGMFLDNNPPGKEFILAPYITSNDGDPIPAENIEPIYMSNYKFKIPNDLNEEDFEYHHWHKIVERSGIG